MFFYVLIWMVRGFFLPFPLQLLLCFGWLALRFATGEWQGKWAITYTSDTQCDIRGSFFGPSSLDCKLTLSLRPCHAMMDLFSAIHPS